MEKYRKTLIHRSIGMAILCILLIITSLFLPSLLAAWLPKFSVVVVQKIYDMSIGAVSGFVGTLISYIFLNIRAVRNSEKLQKRYIQDNDEREKLIAEKTGSSTFNLTACCLIFAMLIARSLNAIVFYTIFAILVGIVAIYLGSWAYYKRKYQNWFILTIRKKRIILALKI